jgi:parvulin-like peptidyl-prolyl isomerase
MKECLVGKWVSVPMFLVTCFACVGTYWLTACGEPQRQNVAVIGAQTITAEQLHTFIKELPESARQAGEGEARIHLQTLIDMEVLLMEAHAERFDASPAFLTRMARIRRDKLVSVFEQRTIDVAVSDSILTIHIEANDLDRAVRVADIMVPDLATANAVVSKIRGGADFGEVAMEWSANQQTASRGGDIGRYVSRYELIPVLSEKLSQLPVGAVSEPIRIGRGYSVFKVLSETTFALNAEQRQKAAEEFYASRFEEARSELVRDLKLQYDLRPDAEGLATFFSALQLGEAAAAKDPLATAIFRFGDGVILGSDAIDEFRTMKGNPLSTVADVGQLQELIDRHVVPKVMLLEAANRAGVAEEPETAEWLTEQGRQLLITGLRATVLRDTEALPEADVRQYYEDHKERFLHPEQTEVQEVLTETLVEAQRLRRLIEEGADLGDLAREHSIRALDVRDEAGRFHIHRHEAPQFGGLVEHAVEVEVGELTGPVQVHDGFSVFRVLSRSRKQETFEEAKLRARSILRRLTQQQVFDDYLQGLRERYDGKVQVFEEAVEAVDARL